MCQRFVARCSSASRSRVSAAAAQSPRRIAVYLFDMDRGIEVLKLRRGTDARAASGHRSVDGAMICPAFKRG